MDSLITEWRTVLDDHLNFALRQFDVGIFEPAEPEMPPAARNYINIGGNMTGSTIAQASPGAKQSVEFNLNVEIINEALSDFETALASASLPLDTLTELSADIRTIRAQLTKSRPNKGIIQEVGKSLRNIVEGIVGGMLTAPAVTAVTAAAAMLWSALGIGYTRMPLPLRDQGAPPASIIKFLRQQNQLVGNLLQRVDASQRGLRLRTS